MSASIAVDLFERERAWHEIVDGQRPVELEIGSGKGLFLRQAAKERPDHDFVGIEIAGKFARLAASRAAQAGLRNVTVLRGDAKKFLASIPDASLFRCHAYFPDPWWRDRHKKRRVLNEQSLSDISRILQPDGELHFWTDVLDYYEHICGRLMDNPQLLGPRYVPQHRAHHDMDYTTHFERRARTHGQPVYRAVFIKRAAPLPTAPVVEVGPASGTS